MSRVDADLLIDTLKLDKARVIGDELTARCPNPNHEDKNPSWSFNLESQFFNCWSCGFSGKGVASLFLKLGLDIPEWVINCNNIHNVKKRVKTSVPIVEVVSVRNSWLSWLSANSDGAYEKLKVRDIEYESIIKFKIGYNADKDILFFPCLDNSMNLLGWVERSDNWDFRYRVMPAGINKGNLIFGGHLISSNDNTIYLVEGPIDCIKMWQWGFKSVAVLGSALLDGHVSWLLDNANYVIVIPDNDKAGLKFRYSVVDKLKGKVRLAGVNLPSNINDVGDNACTRDVIVEAIRNRVRISE